MKEDTRGAIYAGLRVLVGTLLVWTIMLLLGACGGGGGGGTAKVEPVVEDTPAYTEETQRWCRAVLKTVHNAHECSHWNFRLAMRVLPALRPGDVDYARAMWQEDWDFMQSQRDMCFKMIEFRPGWSKRRTSTWRFREHERLTIQSPMVEAGLVYGPVETGSAEDLRITAEVQEMLQCYSEATT